MDYLVPVDASLLETLKFRTLAEMPYAVGRKNHFVDDMVAVWVAFQHGYILACIVHASTSATRPTFKLASLLWRSLGASRVTRKLHSVE